MVHSFFGSLDSTQRFSDSFALSSVVVDVKPTERRLHFQVVVKFPFLPASHFQQISSLGIVTSESPYEDCMRSCVADLIADER